MIIRSKHLPRRTMLKGLGVTLALPLLDAMTPARRRRRAAARRRREEGAPGGHRDGARLRRQHAVRHQEEPVGAGRHRARRSTLRPTQPQAARAVPRPRHDHQQHRRAQAPRRSRTPEIGGDHFRSSAVFLTQMHPKQTQGSDVLVGTSLDQMYAQRASARTRRFRRCSCASRTWTRAAAAPTATRAPTPTRSAGRRPTQPLPMVRDPRVVFDSLFGVGATPGERRERRVEDKSLLDWLSLVGGAAEEGAGRRATARGSTTTSTEVREVERRIQRVEAYNSSGEARELPGRADRRAGLVLRARQADVRPAGAGLRVGPHARVRLQARTRRLEPHLSRRAASTARSTPTSHHGERENTILEFARINHYHVSMVPYFLEKLKNTRRRRRHPARQLAGHLRLADGRLARPQPQALPAVPGRPRRRAAEGRPARAPPPTARRWRTRC